TVTSGAQTVTLVTNTYDSHLWTPIIGDAAECPPYMVCPAIKMHDTANYDNNFIYRGNVTKAVTPGSTTNIYPYKTGTVRRVTDAAGHKITIVPDSDFAAPSAITVGGLTTNLAWTSFLGLSSQTGPNGDTVTIGYDSSARPNFITSPYGARTNYEYTTSPPMVKASLYVDYDPWNHQQQPDRWTKTYMDGFGRTIKTETGTGATVHSVVDTEYDSCACSPMGRVKRVSLPHAPGAPVFWTTYNYDGLGRTTSVSHPDTSGTTIYTYEGNAVKVTDPAGKWKWMVMDAMGNLVRVHEPNPAGGEFLTYYTYDVLNHLTQVTMPRGGTTQTRTWVYNAKQQVQSVTMPETGTVSYIYNTDGTVATKTDAKGIRTEYSYWEKRLTQIKKFDGATERTCDRIDFGYGGGGAGAYTAGRVSSVRYGCPDQGGNPSLNQYWENYTYTIAGDLKTKQFQHKRYTYASNQYTLTFDGSLTGGYEHDKEGKIKSISYPVAWTSPDSPMGTYYQIEYDSLGRPVKMKHTQPNHPGPQVWREDVKNVVYGVSGELKQASYLTAIDEAYSNVYQTETRSYNNLYQLTRITRPGMLDLEYRYSPTNNNGRILQMKNWISGEEVNYHYDALQRLISAYTTGPEWGLNFSYDGYGNRTSQTMSKGTAPPSTNLLYNENTNRIASAGYSYDANGNMTSMPGLSGMQYDSYNRLISVGAGESTETYSYSPDNKRVRKKHPNGGEVFYFHMGGQLMGEYVIHETAFATSRIHLYFNGRRFSTDQPRLSDAFGLSRTLTGMDRLGSDVKGTKYFPYGEEHPATTQDRQKFATYHRDSTTLLDYADQRYYSSKIGRFLSPDPYVADNATVLPLKWNKYAYVGDDPINKTDPSGLDDEKTFCDIYPDHFACHSPRPPSYPDIPEPVLPEADPYDFSHLEDTKQLVRDALEKESCAGLFKTNRYDAEGADILMSILGGGKYGGGVSFRNLGEPSGGSVIAAITQGVLGRNEQGQSIFTGANIYINSNLSAPWFGPDGYPDRFDIRGRYGAQTQNVYRAITLIHELGHAIARIFGVESTLILEDTNDDDREAGLAPGTLSQNNTQAVFDKCFK
ncbi:MAG: RHS repeat domain-containing protein, partial [Bryobacteraceae bacterium]